MFEFIQMYGLGLLILVLVFFTLLRISLKKTYVPYVIVCGVLFLISFIPLFTIPSYGNMISSILYIVLPKFVNSNLVPIFFLSGVAIILVGFVRLTLRKPAKRFFVVGSLAAGLILVLWATVNLLDVGFDSCNIFGQGYCPLENIPNVPPPGGNN